MGDQLIEKLGRRGAIAFRHHGGVDAVIEYLEKDEWKFGSGYAKADLIGLLRKLETHQLLKRLGIRQFVERAPSSR